MPEPGNKLASSAHARVVLRVPVDPVPGRTGRSPVSAEGSEGSLSAGEGRVSDRGLPCRP